MVHVKVGDLFQSTAQTLVNTVNCVGVMGKGIALGFKHKYPDMFRDYMRRCERKQVKLGEPYLYRPLMGQWVLNFPTKDHWRGVARLDEIIRGLEFLKEHYKEWGITSIAVPPLGCGNGQLEWNVVGPTLYRYLSELAIPVELYAPEGTPLDQMTDAFLGGVFSSSLPQVDPKFVPPAHVALVEALSKILDERYRYPVGRTMFQKLAYFATVLEIPTELDFVKGSYGPYSPHLNKVVARLMTNGLIREEQFGNMIAVEPGPTFLDARVAYRVELRAWSPRLDRLSDLFIRMRTADAELAASVHYAASVLTKSKSTSASEQDVFEFIKEWKKRRRPPLKDQDVADTIRGLNLLAWVVLQPSKELPVRDRDILYV